MGIVPAGVPVDFRGFAGFSPTYNTTVSRTLI
jgi:hypothetical protein